MNAWKRWVPGLHRYWPSGLLPPGYRNAGRSDHR